MGRSAAERFLVAIGYPERMPKTDAPFTLRVDGWGVLVEVSAGRIVLSIVLTEDESMIPALAAYAAGRMLREEATLAFGTRSTTRTANTSESFRDRTTAFGSSGTTLTSSATRSAICSSTMRFSPTSVSAAHVRLRKRRCEPLPLLYSIFRQKTKWRNRAARHQKVQLSK